MIKSRFKTPKGVIRKPRKRITWETWTWENVRHSWYHKWGIPGGGGGEWHIAALTGKTHQENKVSTEESSTRVGRSSNFTVSSVTLRLHSYINQEILYFEPSFGWEVCLLYTWCFSLEILCIRLFVLFYVSLVFKDCMIWKECYFGGVLSVQCSKSLLYLDGHAHLFS